MDVLFLIINYYFLIVLSVNTLCACLLTIYFSSVYEYKMSNDSIKFLGVSILQLMVVLTCFMQPYGFIVMMIMSLFKHLLFHKFDEEYIKNVGEHFSRKGNK